MIAQRRDMLAHGLVAGLIGYAVVVAFITMENVIQGRPFFATAAQLGAVLVGRGQVAPAIPLDAAPVIAFNGAHLLVMLGFGTVASYLATIWEQAPRNGYIIMFGFIAAALAVLLASIAVLSGVLRTVTVATIVTVNVAAVIAVATYLLRMHPALAVRYVEMGE
jgi:hypothetical protein